MNYIIQAINKPYCEVTFIDSLIILPIIVIGTVVGAWVINKIFK